MKGMYLAEEIFMTRITGTHEGGGGDTNSGVIFLDYDGSIVERWPANAVAAKTALPNNPSHSGLVAQGWNWTLANIKSYISKYEGSKVVVGQMYKTASGLTEFDITVTKVTGLTVTCNMAGNKTWGDGTRDALTTHTYTDYGDYMITCDGSTISGIISRWCTAVRIGENVTSIGESAFYDCCSLTIITIPDGVTSIGESAFYDCCSLTIITIPDGVTSIGESAFYDCCSLTSISIPDSVTSIDGRAFGLCYSLTSITIPDGVTSIYFQVFVDCYSLTNISIPDSVTSIGIKVFARCYSLTSITIPDGVTSIGVYAFDDCLSLTEYNFTSATTVPTLTNTNAFRGINDICKIVVPDALYDDWKAATNWTAYANYIYKASEVTD